MIAESDQRKSSRDLLQEVLLNYLRASRAIGWPGADGLTADDIVNCYPQAILAGDVPGWHELQSRFPELADELQALRSAKGWLESSPSRDNKPKSSSCDFESPSGTLKKPRVCHPTGTSPNRKGPPPTMVRRSRWLVCFASGSSWFPVGEFIALDAAAAIERAIDVFGPGAAYQAEKIPWDAAPLSRAKTAVVQN
jgi:hypothetical protein